VSIQGTELRADTQNRKIASSSLVLHKKINIKNSINMQKSSFNIQDSSNHLPEISEM